MQSDGRYIHISNICGKNRYMHILKKMGFIRKGRNDKKKPLIYKYTLK